MSHFVDIEAQNLAPQPGTPRALLRQQLLQC